MELEQINSAIAALPVDQRRKVALFILELEKQHLEKTVGPHIEQGIDSFSRVMQEGLDKLKKIVSK